MGCIQSKGLTDPAVVTYSADARRSGSTSAGVELAPFHSATVFRNPAGKQIKRTNSVPNNGQDQSTVAHVPKEVRLAPFADTKSTPKDEITEKFDSLRGGRYAVVLAGFSGLEYDKPEAVKQKITALLDDAIQNHPEGVALVIGGTTDGIGMGYALVESNPKYEAVKLIGIVSEEANKWSQDSLSKACGYNKITEKYDNIIFVPDAKGTWEVMNEAGTHCYTAYAAEKHGEFNVLGGGDVAVKEIEYARKQGVSPKLFQFDPNQEKLQAKFEKVKAKGTTLEMLTPLDAYFKTV